MPRQPRREEYTVEWICALPIELAAGKAMLVERYGNLMSEIGEKVEDLYFMGSTACHKVVIACLPGRTGANSAAAVATRMQAKCKEIQFGLTVSIGGVPSEHTDVRLGDVVVSVPHLTFGCVVQYDMGKTTPTEVKRTGSLDSPPQVLLSAAIALQSGRLLGKSTLLTHLLKTEHIRCFQRSETGLDVLYDTAYNYESVGTCANYSAKK